MSTTILDTLTELDIILIFARDAVWSAEQAEVCARRALTIASEGGDREIEYSARCALVAAIGAASTARATLLKLAEFNRASLESRLKTATITA
jgi:hypothetical protein